jgi:hypothetical protein
MSVIPLIRVRGEAVLRVEPEIVVPAVHLCARDAGPRRDPLHRDGTP